MNSLLIRGLRRRPIQGSEDWRELMTSAVRGEWPAPEASQQTLQAEHGLGISGRPYYFYVLRAEENFGLVVFVLREVEEAVWPANAKGATPFDSGGLWSGRVATHPELDMSGRRVFFQDQDVPLVDWRAAFEDYIRTHYGTVSDYLEGNVPGPGTASQDPGITIIRGSPNDKRAWTWEVRIPYDLVSDRLELQAVCMTEIDRKTYVDWLGRSSLRDTERRQMHRWVQDYTFVPAEDKSVVQAVEDRVAQEVGLV